MPTHMTMCPMNCHPTYCGMRVTVADGQVAAISGDPDNPDSRGFLCVRGRAAHEIVGNPRRLLHPLRRVGPRGSDQWEPISWEAALAAIADAIRATAPERVGVWMGHGASVTGVSRSLMLRFGYLGGFQVWNPAMVCWALGAYGLALTGVLETNTKEDLAAHAETILFWGANLASQPTTAPHLVAARRRGAHVTVIDCRRTETARHADEVLIIRPGTDAALALAMAHVIVAEGLADEAFLAEHSVGYPAFREHVARHTPEWAAPITGIPAETIRGLARRYATARPAMIVLGGSSPFKHQHGWEVGRAVACLPALTGQLGIAGGGFGPRHRGLTHGDGLALLDALDRRPPGSYIPNHMPSIEAALTAGQLDVFFLLGTNMLSSFAHAGAITAGLQRTGLVVACDIFLNESIRQVADIILPGTIWLEELGFKDTATHIYLMDQLLPPAGAARSIPAILRDLAERLGIPGYYPWRDHDDYVNAILAPQRNPDGSALTVAQLRALGGYWERSGLSHIAYPTHRYHTPSGKVELFSARAESAGLPALPSYTESAFTAPEHEYPLQLGQGRTLTHFHSFYDEGRALPSLARANPHPELWINPADAEARGIAHKAPATLHNAGGALAVIAHVTGDVPPGVVWIRDGWHGLNHLTSGAGALTAAQSGLIHPTHFPGGQAAYDARVEVRRA